MVRLSVWETDNRQTLITDLEESGAGDQTIMDIAGHVSKRMQRHYSHIRMEAKRTALESIVKTAWKNVRKNAKVTGRWHETDERGR